MKKLMLILVACLLVAGSAQAVQLNSWSLNESPIVGNSTVAVDAQGNDDGLHMPGNTAATGRPGGDGGADFGPGGVLGIAAHTPAQLANSTVVAWFKSDTAAGRQFIYTEGTPGTWLYSLWIMDNKMSLIVASAAHGNADLTYSGNLVADQWYMAAAVMEEGVGRKLYLWDGTTMSMISDTKDGVPTTATHVAIGQTAGRSTLKFDGEIDDVQFYDNVLTAEQIAAIPEPATMALLGLGSLVMLRRRKNS